MSCFNLNYFCPQDTNLYLALRLRSVTENLLWRFPVEEESDDGEDDVRHPRSQHRRHASVDGERGAEP